MTMTIFNRPSGATILLVEDDPAVALTVSEVLAGSGHQVRLATDGSQVGAILAEGRPDLIVLDLMLPDADGLILCADLKAKTDAPILICSALDQPRERLLSFKLGADDFVPKPFDVAELEARVEALLRRTAATRAAAVARTGAEPAEQPDDEVTRVGELEVDRRRRRVTLGGAELRLTPTEYRILCALVAHADDVLTREELAQMAWGYQDVSAGRAIDAHMRRLRVKLAQGRAPAPPIVSVRGFGYKILKEDLFAHQPDYQAA